MKGLTLVHKNFNYFLPYPNDQGDHSRISTVSILVAKQMISQHGKDKWLTLIYERVGDLTTLLIFVLMECEEQL